MGVPPKTERGIPMDGYVLILTTVPDGPTAKSVATGLLEGRLAACVTVMPSCESRYWWEGKIAEEQELTLFIKTRSELFDLVEAKIKALHPYRVPEVIAVPILRGSPSYLDWISSETEERA